MNITNKRIKQIKKNGGNYILCENCKNNQASTNCVLVYCGDCCKKEKDDIFCPRHHLRRPLKVNKDIKFSTKLRKLPPWLEYPSYRKCSIGWRMGDGEDYYHKFWKNFKKLTPTEQKWYQQDFPEPDAWKGFYMSDYYYSSESADFDGDEVPFGAPLTTTLQPDKSSCDKIFITLTVEEVNKMLENIRW